MRYFVTGGAGFIGSNLVDRLLAHGHDVVAFDNLSTGFASFLANARTNERFSFFDGDLLDDTALTTAMAGADFVFHLAANADVRFGTQHPRKDLEQNTIATCNVLEAMRANRIQRMAFTSTGSVYGEPDVFPTPEDAPFPIQTSLYAASKLAGEAQISASCEGFGFQATIFRFVSILGPRYTHGHVFDFYRKLLDDPTHLPVLGNGRQRKSYLHVDDALDAVLLAIDRAPSRLNIFNLGAGDYCEVLDSIGWITSKLGLSPKIELAGGERGWIGDSPFIFLDTTRIRSLGWTPRYSIREGVLSTLTWLMNNRWVLEQRT